MLNSELTSFLESPDQPVLDIRSPAEFARGHIPCAISFPLFSNRERAEVGILYKKAGRNVAFKKGLEIVGPKMKMIVERAEELDSEHLRIYCWRGGMRSKSMGWLLEQAGFSVTILQGGYKTYRRAQLEYFGQALPLVVISGYTGSKKTQLLHQIEKNGGQMVDLEGLANHQGSSFGNQRTTGQPTTEHFQNLVFEAFRSCDLDRMIFIEDECFRIGKVNLPERLHAQKERSPHIVIKVPKAERIGFLVQDYGQLSQGKLIAAIRGISRKLGGKETKRAIEFIESNTLDQAADIVISYYDKQYNQALLRKKDFVIDTLEVSLDDHDQLAKQLTTLPVDSFILNHLR